MKRRHALAMAMLVGVTAAACLRSVALGGEDPVDAAHTEDVVVPSDGPKRDAGEDGGQDAAMCMMGAFANGSGLCSTDRSFFQSALATCAQSSTVLAAYAGDEACEAGLSNTASYTCCKSAPMGCTKSGFGNGGGLCATDDSFFVAAEQTCIASHAVIAAFAPDDGGCDAGSATSGGYTCCP